MVYSATTVESGRKQSYKNYETKDVWLWMKEGIMNSNK